MSVDWPISVAIGREKSIFSTKSMSWNSDGLQGERDSWYADEVAGNQIYFLLVDKNCLLVKKCVDL